MAADFLDDYVRMSESTIMESLEHFCESIISVFSSKYLRQPNTKDIKRLLHVGEARGFPGMLGSIDGMLGFGTCVLLHGKACIKEKKVSHQ